MEPNQPIETKTENTTQTAQVAQPQMESTEQEGGMSKKKIIIFAVIILAVIIVLVTFYMLINNGKLNILNKLKQGGEVAPSNQQSTNTINTLQNEVTSDQVDDTDKEFTAVDQETQGL